MITVDVIMKPEEPVLCDAGRHQGWHRVSFRGDAYLTDSEFQRYADGAELAVTLENQGDGGMPGIVAAVAPLYQRSEGDGRLTLTSAVVYLNGQVPDDYGSQVGEAVAWAARVLSVDLDQVAVTGDPPA